MMVRIRRNILSHRASNVPGRSMKPKYITVHNTANTSRGADAEMHARYQHNGSGGRQVSWHYTVDDKEVWQTLEDNQQGWHAGDGSGSGNTESIGVEICENSDGDFQKAVSNAQNLIKQLMDKHDIPLSNVVTHKHWSGKNCPRLLLNTWSSFKDGITGKSSAPSKSKSSGSSEYTGNSIVDYLISIEKDSSFNARKRYAADYGISNYRGSAAQNKQLLDKMRGGKTKTSSGSTSTVAKPTLRRGSRGKEVEKLQSQLDNHSPRFNPQGVDGIYGAKTEDAVLRYQKYYGVRPYDGIYGTKTEAKMKETV